MQGRARVFVALDSTDLDRTLFLARAVKPHVGGLKLGMEFFYAAGHAGYRAVADSGLPIFLDLKLHDIPNTIAQGARALVGLRPKILTVHASNGPAGLRAVADAVGDEAARLGVEKPIVVAVTVLTSLDGADLQRIGVLATPGEQVLHLAQLARDSGVDGVVCSAHEVANVKALWPSGTFVVPGIRPVGADVGDQKRVMTPRQALEAGASVLVIGRPITAAADPAAASAVIAEDIEGL